ncbi:uncharacterized protein Ecym_8370 [Eremothecium cymbalariae DBVPG|uniref:Uncharacterized protein n=1 Tax=Eremothecium cymbalariae (strain CBS 270.75 / DBVPG 7215 / KCTC 17166 / NRRL Y-17582) TaxID=931890 RepID=G8JXR7_ERECY|nr:Hypothetical protein Ecym_8370 [Eremothecium cymbalariae DBVPG\
MELPGYYYDEERGKYFKITNNTRQGLGEVRRYDREELKRKQRDDEQQVLAERIRSRERKAVRRIVVERLERGPARAGARGTGVVDSLLQCSLQRRECETGGAGLNYREHVDIFSGAAAVVGEILPYVSVVEAPSGGDSGGLLVAVCDENGTEYVIQERDGKIVGMREMVRGLGSAVPLALVLPVRYAGNDAHQGWLLNTGNEYILSSAAAAPVALSPNAAMRTPACASAAISRIGVASGIEVFDMLELPVSTATAADYINVVCLAMHNRVQFLTHDYGSGLGASRHGVFRLPRTLRVPQQQQRTDVLSLAGTVFGELFAGCRAGQLFRFKFHPDNRTDDVLLLQYFNGPVVNIKFIPNTRLLVVSVFAHPCQCVYLITVDYLQNPIIARFKSKFQNTCKRTEILHVSDDGSYLIYGSLLADEGRGDFEVFSTNVTGQLVTDYDETTKVPIVHAFKSMKSCIPKQSIKRLLAVTLTTSHHKEHSDFEHFHTRCIDHHHHMVYRHVSPNGEPSHLRLISLSKDEDDVGIVLRSVDLL